MPDPDKPLPLDINEIAPETVGGDLSLIAEGHRALFSALFQGIPGRAVLVDTQGHYRLVNQEFLDFVGRSEAEVIGAHVSDILDPDVYASYAPVIPRLLAGEPLRWEGWADYGSLGRRYVQESVTPYRPMPEGPVEGFLAIARDLTDLKLREQELAGRIAAHEAAEARHAAIVRSALDGIVVMDANGTVVDFNPAAQAIFGYGRGEAIGRPVADLIVPPEYRAAHRAGLAAYLATGDARVLGRRLELSAMLAGGERIPVELAVTDISDGEERIFAAHVRDLRAAKAAEEEIQRQRGALHQKEKLAALGSLLAGVAHELNNPLSIVTGQTLMLRDQAIRIGDERLIERCDRIGAAADRCARIVRSFLAMARQREAERRPADLAAVIDEAVELLAYNLRAAGVTVDRDMPARLPLLMLDAGQIHQVLLNLIVNAQHALEEKDGDRRIRISAVPETGTVRLTVADNGPGVPQAIASRIFDPFFTTKPQGSGTGIGLAVSRGLIEAHGGTLELERPAGGGAAFTLRLPVKATGPGPAAAEDRPAPHAAGGGQVLIVDDETEIAALLGEIVEALGYTPVLAHSGREAKAVLAHGAERFSAILCDIRMPDGDGPNLYDWLLEHCPALGQRIGFITGDALGPSAGRFLARSGSPVLEKPFVPADIRVFLADLTA
ncbi:MULTISPECIES: PAS domain S-box protein [Chelatococcus]|uniref:histidine kinase n=1 Tax=Chelatococcus caeni TaxID=1348468 RepID=A0A840CAH2_9HYPH|nr:MULTISPECIES: PAS domain S-box protein [Chelatococcus]ALA16829.1 histidine kinase [Chelatococcus sp. CO-6]MBB4019856.1 two-component system NtrC family sensor kinase [Chelatococcus caeni]